MIRFYLRIFNSTSTINGFTYFQTTPGTYRTYDITNEVIENEDITIDKRVEYDSLDSIATDEVSLVISKNKKTENLLLNDKFKALYIKDADKLYFAGLIDDNRIINYNEETFEIKANGILSFLFDLLDFVPLPLEQEGSNYDYNLNYFLSRTLTATPEFRLREFLDYNFYEDFFRIGLPEFSNTDFRNLDYFVIANASQHWFQGDAKYKYMAKDLLLEVLKHYLAMIYVHSSKRLIVQSKLYLTNPHNLPNLSENILKIVDYALDDIIWEVEYSVYDGILFNLIDVYDNGWMALYPKNAELITYTTPLSDYINIYRKVFISKEGFGDGDYLDLRLKILTDKGIQIIPEARLFTDYPKTITSPFANNKLIYLYLYSVPKNEFNGYDSLKDTQFGIFEKLLNKKTSILKTTLTGLDYNIGDFFEFNNKIFILYEMKLNLTQNTTEVAMREIK
jgi:hypothetical protein